MREGLIYTNDNCIGCNKCVRICSSFGASVSKQGPDKTAIRINSDRCIVCGACVDVCGHEARQYLDDTERFFCDLANGEPISVLVAPAFAAKYPNSYRNMLGTLRRMGVKQVIPVSLGADICTWAYIKCMQDNAESSLISTSCPVVVSYIEHWMPSLISRLMPVKSPLMCIATYCREELGITDRLAFVGPCIAKSLETQRYPDLVQYNVTFPKLIERLENEERGDVSDFDDIPYGLGSYYPAPGGLADNVRWLLGDDVSVRVVSGKTYLYERFERGRHGIFSQGLPYALVDALNCTEGCIEGTARLRYESDEVGLAHIQRIRSGSKSTDPDSPWNPNLTPQERLERLNAQFANLSLDSYRAHFVDQGDLCAVQVPSEEELQEVFRTLHKTDEPSQQINCSACGYETCMEMAVAIHNGFNSRYNCVYFEKEESIRLTRMSYTDQLTGVLNRNALESIGTELYGKGHSLALVVTDVNGLKRENDTKGHGAGDRMIVSTARALANCFGCDRVFRTGGDEFLAILQDHAKNEVEEGIDEVKAHLATLDISASMGMAYEEAFSGAFDPLLKLADSRMYEDKARYYKEHGSARG
ncbi:MAG: [Fe-Fe] hydrogenase large subunit C-terminal domain-containing protein [Coriobacteriales bacterium]|nr:[Fe-Fe] hydrogenase large subunit C-terminal domain-containing protein [Coriobacteriales bacterium]